MFEREAKQDVRFGHHHQRRHPFSFDHVVKDITTHIGSLEE